jgi:Tol biopolymer transport system component
MNQPNHSYENLTRIDYPKVEEDSAVPTLTREALRTEARAGLEQIRDFITTDAFITVLGDLYALAPEDRDAYVRRVLLDPGQLAARGIVAPDGIKVQRSQFGDHRPTIFCVTKLMSDGVRKVTYTFDSDSLAAAV